jgi:hypothetical protein
MFRRDARTARFDAVYKHLTRQVLDAELTMRIESFGRTGGLKRIQTIGSDRLAVSAVNDDQMPAYEVEGVLFDPVRSRVVSELDIKNFVTEPKSGFQIGGVRGEPGFVSSFDNTEVLDPMTTSFKVFDDYCVHNFFTTLKPRLQPLGYRVLTARLRGR